MHTYVYELEFSIRCDGVYYKSLKCLFNVKVHYKDIADKIVAMIFSDNDNFVGAKCIGFF